MKVFEFSYVEDYIVFVVIANNEEEAIRKILKQKNTEYLKNNIGKYTVTIKNLEDYIGTFYV